MRVKELAELTATTVRTVRYYHQVGLLPVPRQSGGMRDYGMAHLARLLRIRWLVDSGVALSAVRSMLEDTAGGPDDREVVCTDLALTLSGIDERLSQLQEQRAQIARLLRTATEGGPVSPMPTAVHEMYEQLLRRATDADVQRLIIAERQVVEFTCYRSELPPVMAELAARLTDRQLDRIIEMFDEFARLNRAMATLDAAEINRRVDEMADHSAEFVEELSVAPDLVAGLLEQASLPVDGYVGYALTTVFPQHLSQRFQAAFADGLMKRGVLTPPMGGESHA